MPFYALEVFSVQEKLDSRFTAFMIPNLVVHYNKNVI